MAAFFAGMDSRIRDALAGMTPAVIPEMPEALSGIVPNAGACCDPG